VKYKRKEQIGDATLFLGDCREGLRELPDGVAKTCVTSPPYFGLRDYGHDGQIGLESTPDEFVSKLVEVFREVRRALDDDGTAWLNLGDSYASGLNNGGCAKPKDLLGIPWRVAFALQADGWYLRQDIVWHKPNPMPESVRDRCTKAHEYLFLLSKSPRYYFDQEAIKEAGTGRACGNTKPTKGGREAECGSVHHRTAANLHAITATDQRNKRSVWTVTTKPFRGAHFAVFPPDLIEPCILAGSAPGDLVIDPFAGSGTTGIVAGKHNRRFYGCELNAEYHAMAEDRIAAAYAQGRLFA